MRALVISNQTFTSVSYIFIKQAGFPADFIVMLTCAEKRQSEAAPWNECHALLRKKEQDIKLYLYYHPKCNIYMYICVTETK